MRVVSSTHAQYNFIQGSKEKKEEKGKERRDSDTKVKCVEYLLYVFVSMKSDFTRHRIL